MSFADGYIINSTAREEKWGGLHRALHIEARALEVEAMLAMGSYADMTEASISSQTQLPNGSTGFQPGLSLQALCKGRHSRKK